MRRITVFVVVALASFYFTACSEKFKVAAPYKSITVIYGLLDRADTAHYIRIQKAFLDENKSAVSMAQSSDSNFFKNINVCIKRIEMGTDIVVDTIHLNRVDLTAEGYPKQSGTFFNAPNYAYKFKNTLDPNYIYRIVVTNPSSGEVDSSESPIIDDVTFSTYKVDITDTTSIVYREGIDFSDTNPFTKVTFSGSYVVPGNFLFNGQTSPIALAQGICRFHWVDSSITQHKSSHYYDFNMGYQAVSNGSFGYQIKDLDFYAALQSGMDQRSDSIYRLIDRCEMFFYVGTADFNTYIQIASVQGTGLTGNEVEPMYSNIKGQNALGLFTARGLKHGYVTLAPATVDSLVFGKELPYANIRGTVYH